MPERLGTASRAAPAGATTSLGTRSAYLPTASCDQDAKTPTADLSAQGVRTDLPPCALEPAVLPGVGVPEVVAWSRSKNNSYPFCDRPGCYEGLRPSCRCPARYCGDPCRQAVRQAYD